MKTLNQLKPGEEGVIVKIHCPSSTKMRLMAMGVTPGAPVLLQKYAPLGDPLEVRIRGYELSVRKEDAKGIEIR